MHYEYPFFYPSKGKLKKLDYTSAKLFDLKLYLIYAKYFYKSIDVLSID